MFERRTNFAESSDLGISIPVSYDWYINGLHVDAATFKERFDEAVIWRAAQNGHPTVRVGRNIVSLSPAAHTPAPRLTESDREFLRSLRIAADDDAQDKAA